MIAAISSDPVTVLRWVLDHFNDAGWAFAIGAGALAWAFKRIRTWQGANPSVPSRLLAAAAAQRAAATASAAGAAVAPAGVAAYVSAPAYAPAPAGRPARAPAGAARVADAVAGVGSAVEVDLRPRRAILEAFGDPANARTAVVLAEILAPPVGLR